MSSTLTAVVVPGRADGLRLDLALAELLPNRSRRSLRATIARGEISIDGRAVRVASRPVAPGQVVTLPFDPSDPAPPPELAVLAENEAFLAIDKPPGLLSEPASATSIGEAPATVLEIVRRRFALSGVARPFVACVGRLDRPVSGVMLLAKSGSFHGKLVEAMARPEARKFYLALTESAPEKDVGEIDFAITRTGPSSHRTVDPNEPLPHGAKQAKSSFRILQRGTSGALVEIRLHTGRTHQARLHLAAIGAAIVGDTRYGSSAPSVGEPGTPGPPPRRVFLHAARVELGWSGKALEIVSPLPDDFRAAMASRGLTRMVDELRRASSGSKSNDGASR